MILFDELPQVYGAAKYDQKVNEAPSAVTIITADQIKKYGYRTFAQILDSVPGMFTTNDRNYAYLGIRGFNRPGDYNTRVLLLIDNHRMNDAVYDQAQLGTEASIDVDLIDRIEIIRGPASSLYGTNAFLGVINVITKRGRDIRGVELTGEAASFNTRTSRVTYGDKYLNGAEVMLSGSFSQSDGNRELYYPEFDTPATNNGIAEDADRDAFFGFAGKVSVADVTFSSGHIRREKNVPTAAYGTAFNDNRLETLDERLYAELTYQRELVSLLGVKARLSYDRYRYQGDYPFDYSGIGTQPFTINHDDTDADWWGAEFLLTKRLRDRHRVTVGAEYRDDFRQDQFNRDVDPPVIYVADKRRSNVISAYLQDELRITDVLVLNAGVRHDQYSTFGGTTNPRAALTYTRDETTYKFIYGQAFRAPNPYEQFYGSGSVFVPSPDLKPETIKTYEVVIEHYLGNHLRAVGSLYQYNIRGLITQTVDPIDGRVSFDNVEDIRARGTELTLEGKWPSGLEGRLSYALQTARDDQTNQRLTNSPSHVAKASLIVPLRSEALLAGLEARYTSCRLTLAGNCAAPFYVVNTSLFSQRLVEGVELSGHINNLLNTQYGYPGSGEHQQEVIDQDGRTFWVKLKYRF